MSEPLISIKAVAERLGIGVRTVWRLLDSGALPRPIRLGRSVRFDPADIDAFIVAAKRKAQ